MSFKFGKSHRTSALVFMKRACCIYVLSRVQQGVSVSVLPCTGLFCPSSEPGWREMVVMCRPKEDKGKWKTQKRGKD